MTIREKVIESLKALGTNVSWIDAEKWLNTKYGKSHGVRDSQYYGIRSEARQGRVPGVVAISPNTTERKSPPVVAALLQETTPRVPGAEVLPELVDTNDVTFAELRELSAYCKAHGGRDRVRRVMRCLGDLTD